MKGRICIVTNAPVSQNPRTVKEADALSAAGFEVTVLFVQYGSWTFLMDETIVKRSNWNAVITQARGRTIFEVTIATIRKVRAKLCECLCRFMPINLFSVWAYSRFFSVQLKQACRIEADLYIGHNPQSLPIVAHAARKVGARFAFDAEDFHTGQYLPEESQLLNHRLLRDCEATYLPKASYVTGASFGITRALEQTYGLARTETILNVFPASEMSSSGSSSDPVDRVADSQRISLYWYSQIIGADRGLQTLLIALDGLSEFYELHLRGHINAEVRASLLNFARSSRFESQLHLHDPISPDLLRTRAADHDIGLCLESPMILNRDLCTTNKIFHYCQAGLFVLASDTQGQVDVFNQTPDIGMMYSADSVESLRQALRAILVDRRKIEKGKLAALHAAQSRWNWERESEKLISLVSRNMEQTPT